MRGQLNQAPPHSIIVGDDHGEQRENVPDKIFDRR